MDPLCHTFLGAVLAATPLAARRGSAAGALPERRWGAAATLVVAANLPDVDAFLYFLDGDLALLCRRGWTHGVLAIAVLPLLLALAVTAVGRWRRAPVEPGALVALAYLGLATHPFLDWLNTYGMRWLMPFSGRWSYGDTLFIVDPWLWLILGGAAFLAWSRRRRALVGWTIVALLASLAVVADVTPDGSRVIWLCGLVALGTARFAGPPTPARRRRIAVAAILVAALYVAAMGVAGRRAAAAVRAELGRTGGLAGVREIYAGPMPADPRTWDALVVTAEGYREARVRLGEPVTLAAEVLPRGRTDAPQAVAALAAPCVAGFANWLRFPMVRVVPGADGGSLVEIRDARYARRGEVRGIGLARVALAADGTVAGCS